MIRCVFASPKNTKIQSLFDLEKWNAQYNKIFAFWYWDNFFDSKSWITILNMNLEFEQIETLGIRS